MSAIKELAFAKAIGGGGGGGSTADFEIEIGDAVSTDGFAVPNSPRPNFAENSVPNLMTKLKSHGVKTITSGAFVSCKNLESIDVPDVENFNGNSFSGCIKLTRIVLPSAKSIDTAFSGCTALSYIYIGPNCTSITSGSFGGVPVTCKVECGFAEGAISGFPSSGGWAGNPSSLDITYNVPVPTE